MSTNSQTNQGGPMRATLHELRRRQWLALSLLVGLALPLPALAESSPVWEKVRYQLFGTDDLKPDKERSVIALDIPERAMDSAIVPVSITGRIAQSSSRYIEKVWLIIDNNPSPVAAEFSMTPASGRAAIETRVRIDKPGLVRAVARLNDGTTWMDSKHIQASGGCSVPFDKDPDAVSDLGEMRLRLRGRPVQGRSVAAQLMIRHPNASGLAVNPITQLPQIAHFVREIKVDYAGETILTANVDFSISENPNFRFWLRPDQAGLMTATVVDSEDNTFSQTLEIQPIAAQ